MYKIVQEDLAAQMLAAAQNGEDALLAQLQLQMLQAVTPAQRAVIAQIVISTRDAQSAQHFLQHYVTELDAVTVLQLRALHAEYEEYMRKHTH